MLVRAKRHAKLFVKHSR